MLDQFPASDTPARAGRARDNFYRGGLDDDQLRTLARAAKRSGLRDEATYLRLLLDDARHAGNKDDLVKLIVALARVEEADSRINMRAARDRDDESQLFRLTQYMFDRVRTLVPAHDQKTLENEILSQLTPDKED
ncbi:MAG: hypothetical protein WEB00_10330 [Dehalococcoidia bacterium]